jgi:5'-phosphate synthase pdxT subunit
MRIGLLALQGAFLDHYGILKKLGASITEVRCPSDLLNIERLIIPGGESTVMSKYIQMFNLKGPLKDLISQGLPVWGICAGSILLARSIDGQPGVLGLLDVALRRNAYGRQSQSTLHEISIPLLKRTAFQAPFIRAPQITHMEKSVRALAHYGNDPVFVQQGALMATTFHPELTEDTIFHEYFLDI